VEEDNVFYRDLDRDSMSVKRSPPLPSLLPRGGGEGTSVRSGTSIFHPRTREATGHES